MVKGPDPGFQLRPGHGLPVQSVEKLLAAGQLAGLALFQVCEGGLLGHALLPNVGGDTQL